MKKKILGIILLSFTALVFSQTSYTHKDTSTIGFGTGFLKINEYNIFLPFIKGTYTFGKVTDIEIQYAFNEHINSFNTKLKINININKTIIISPNFGFINNLLKFYNPYNQIFYTRTSKWINGWNRFSRKNKN